MRGKAIYSLGGSILQLLMRLMRFSVRKFVETAEKRPGASFILDAGSLCSGVKCRDNAQPAVTLSLPPIANVIILLSTNRG